MKVVNMRVGRQVVYVRTWLLLHQRVELGQAFVRLWMRAIVHE